MERVLTYGMIIGIQSATFFLRFSPRIVQLFPSPDQAKVDSIITNGTWKWSVGRRVYAEVRDIIDTTLAHFLPQLQYEDQVFLTLTIRYSLLLCK